MSNINPQFEPDRKQGACQKNARPVRDQPQNVSIKRFSRSLGYFVTAIAGPTGCGSLAGLPLG